MTAAQLERLARQLCGAPLGVGIGFAIGTGDRGAITSFAIYGALQLVMLGAGYKSALREADELKRTRAQLDEAMRRVGA